MHHSVKAVLLFMLFHKAIQQSEWVDNTLLMFIRGKYCTFHRTEYSERDLAIKKKIKNPKIIS